jgi:hypothetical protein
VHSSAGQGANTLTWSKIVGALKRLDDHLSDAVYLHGCYLTGQEKIIRHHRLGKAGDHSQEHSNASGVRVPGQLRADGRKLFHC